MPGAAPGLRGLLLGTGSPVNSITGVSFRISATEEDAGDLFLTVQFSPCGKEKQVITAEKELRIKPGSGVPGLTLQE